MASLRELEKTGQYVFHGSGDKIEIFEPRQAHTYINGKKEPDDKPGVHASPLLDIAAFKALVNKHSCPGGYRSGFSYNNEKVTFRVTEKTLRQLANPKGFVYVFDKKDFKKRGSVEYICYKPIKPHFSFEVGINDLPKIQSVPDNVIP